MYFIYRFLLLIGAIITLDASARIEEHQPKVIHDVKLQDLNGKELHIDQLEGNVLILHFWATWCPNCVKEMESLNRLQKIVKKEPIIVLPISEDFKGAKVIEDFYHDHNLRNLVAFLDSNNKLFKQFKLASLPFSMILDSSGRQVAIVKTPIDWTEEKVIKLLRKYVANKSSDNQDYTQLLQEHKIFEDASIVAKDMKPVVPQSAETNLAPKADQSNTAEVGQEIVVTNSGNSSISFKVRRPVNSDTNNNKD